LPLFAAQPPEGGTHTSYINIAQVANFIFLCHAKIVIEIQISDPVPEITAPDWEK
jgi:hypothetical protein